MERAQFEEIVMSSFCKSEVCLKLGFHVNGTGYRKVDEMLRLYGTSIQHFDPKKKSRKYKSESKVCPVCKIDFRTLIGHPREKQTCGYRCSNTYFRSGTDNGNRKPDDKSHYVTVCWRYHKKECVVCDENIIVEVHHYNEVHDDNRPQNLVPLCPTHHQYWHSRHRYLIQSHVDEYVKKFVDLGMG